MKILHVIPGLTWERGGPSAVVNGLARHQAEAGHCVTVLTTDQGARNGERPLEMPSPVEVERLAVRGPDRLAYAAGFVRALRARLPQADVVHVHSIFTYPVHVALREAKAAGVPVILRPCGLLHPYSLGHSRLQKRIYLALWGHQVRQACSAWHYTSAEETQKSWPHDSSPHFVMQLGVEPADFAVDRSQARKQVWQSLPDLQNSPYVLFLGRLHAKKRLDILLEAFLGGAPQPFKLVVAGPDGEGLWEGLCARLLTDPAAAARVVRVGTIIGREKVALLAGASLFALASEHENFGVAGLEALAAGTPVLLSPHVDLVETVRAADLGYEAPVQVEAWRQQLAAVLANEASLTAISARAPHWVRQHHSWSRIAAESVERYRWVMGGCRALTPKAMMSAVP